MNFSSVEMLHLIVKTTCIFFALLILTRIVGRMQLSEMTFFHYVTGITIGSVAANMISESDGDLWIEFTCLAWWCVLTILLSYIGLKCRAVRVIVGGQPIIIIKDGRMIKKSFQQTRINMEDLCMLLREQNIFSIKEVNYAILEPDGKLSVMKKHKNLAVTKEDLNINAPEAQYLPAEVIVDGKIVKPNMQEFQLSEEWVLEELKRQGIHSIKKVLYAELQEDGSLYVENM